MQQIILISQTFREFLESGATSSRPLADAPSIAIDTG